MLIKSYGIVYLATSPSGKAYVGCTKHNLATRISQHKHQAFKNKAKTKFYDAMRKYGFEVFVWSIIEECASKAELLEKEIFHIARLGSYSNGYNLTPGGEAGLGCVTPAHKKKLSIRNSGKGNPRYGAKVSEKTRRKISEGNKGKRKGIPVGPFSEEHKLAISKAKKGTKMHPNAKEALKKANLGRHHDDATKNLMRHLNKTKLKIKCLNTDKIYDSVIVASRELGLDNSQLCKHLKGLYSSVKGFRFKKVA